MSFDSGEEQICIRLALKSEVVDISDFLPEHFSSGNPMELSYVHKQDAKTPEHDEHNGFILKAIVDENVLVAIKASTLVGVLIADTIDSKSKGHLVSTADTEGVENHNDIENFLAYINAKSNVCQRYDVDKSFHIEIVGVHQGYREQKIGKKLFEAGIEVARSKHFQLVSVDCVNVYMFKIAEKLGMECASIVTYDEYNNRLEKCLFIPIPPHTEIKTFVKKL